jgi:hypothetical protein
MKKGVKITIGIGTTILIGILVWLMFFKKDSKLYVLKGKGSGLDPLQPGEQNSASAQPGNEVSSPGASSGGSGGFFTGSSNVNPFTSKEEITAFQRYVLDVIKDVNILGSYGADGVWGSRTANAYQKYGEQYHAYQNPQASVKANLESAGITYQMVDTNTQYPNIRVVFMRGSYKYVARFYNNGRVVFYIHGKSNFLSKGNYSNGGKKIVITEGRREGSTFSNSDLLKNMQNAIAPTSTGTQSGATTQAIGKKVYPSGSYVNIRSSAMVDDGWVSNKLGKINSPNVIGTVTNFTMGTESTPKVWYKVDLLTALSDSTTPGIQTGWVRADKVKF